MCRPKGISFLVTLILFFSVPVTAEHIKVDMDTRSDSTAAGFLSWQGSHGTYKTFGDIGIHLETPNLPPYTEWKINWYNKDGLNKYELAMDCLYANFDDDTTSHPSFEGGTILMTLEGFSEGTHTIITYHNAPWPVSKYGRTICSCKVYVDDVEQFTVQPSQYVTDDANVESTFFTVEATAGEPVVIKLEPVGDPSTEICTAVLSGFEIDNPAAVGSYATNPIPVDGDEHVFANNDDPGPGLAGTGYTQLSWTPSEFAEYQDIYFGTSETDVTDANTSSTEVYKGRQSVMDSTWDANNLDSKFTYYWRVDTVRPDGSVTKGYIWRFRTRRLAFPTAEGYGRFARGGRFGRVLEVTTLEDYNLPGGEEPIVGSLRYAMEEEKGPRVVVFRVGGNINLKRRITIPSDGGDVYVAGQTAPGEGICITRYGFGTLGSSDVIMRFIRNRVGDYCRRAMDGIGLASSDHCIVDHCTISWTIDEGHSSRGAHNITFQRNIISEALHDSYHYLDVDRTRTESHAFAASISGNIGSYHHNLLAHCTARNWSLAGGLEQDGRHYAGHVDIRNNVVYNWRHKTTDGGCKRVNFVNNYYKPGPARRVSYLMRPDGDELNLGDMQQFYIVGNKMEGIIDPNLDNWDHVEPQAGVEPLIRVDNPFFPSFVTTQSADEAYGDVLDDVGATRPMRDPIDARIVEEVRTGTFTYRGSKQNLPGIIDSQEDVGGYREYTGGPVPDDTDHDGMPDWWEIWHGFDPNSPAESHLNISSDQISNADSDGDGYGDLEDYLEYLAQGGRQLQSSPVASPTAVPDSGTAPLEVQFTANASDPDGDPLDYYWEFGDGDASTEADPNHTYNTAGDYDVSLTVSDGIGEVSKSLTVTVNSPMELSVGWSIIKFMNKRGNTRWPGWKYEKRNNKDWVMIRAGMTPYEPQPDEVISLICDGIKLFEAPFSMFVQSDYRPNLYILHQPYTFVRLDNIRGTLMVFRRNINLSSLDNSDGVDVELHIGDEGAVESIAMTERPGRKLVFKRL